MAYISIYCPMCKLDFCGNFESKDGSTCARCNTFVEKK